MLRSGKSVSLCFVVGALASLAGGSAQAGTIIKLSLSAAPADITFDGTTLSTVDDGDGTTNGDQNTSAIFLDFLDAAHADILLPEASFSLGGLTVDGPASPFPDAITPFLVIQNFTGGTFELFDTDGTTLLLSGSFDDSTLTGPVGPPATGALFTTSFANVTGGSLKPLIEPGSLTLSMNFAQINGGAGFSIDTAGAAPKLNSFEADASVIISADEAIIPEPASVCLAWLGALFVGMSISRRC